MRAASYFHHPALTQTLHASSPKRTSELNLQPAAIVCVALVLIMLSFASVFFFAFQEAEVQILITDEWTEHLLDLRTYIFFT